MQLLSFLPFIAITASTLAQDNVTPASVPSSSTTTTTMTSHTTSTTTVTLYLKLAEPHNVTVTPTATGTGLIALATTVVNDTTTPLTSAPFSSSLTILVRNATVTASVNATISRGPPASATATVLGTSGAAGLWSNGGVLGLTAIMSFTIAVMVVVI